MLDTRGVFLPRNYSLRRVNVAKEGCKHKTIILHSQYHRLMTIGLVTNGSMFDEAHTDSAGD